MHVGNCRETRLLVFVADFFFLTFPCKTCKVPVENSRKRSTCKTSIPECLCVFATDSHACTILPSSLYPVQGFSFSVFPFFILALPIAHWSGLIPPPHTRTPSKESSYSGVLVSSVLQA